MVLVNEIWLNYVLHRFLVSYFKGVRKVVRLGDKLVDWNDNFRLFLFTCLTENQLPPELVALVDIINFNTTKAGLAEQVCCVY